MLELPKIYKETDNLREKIVELENEIKFNDKYPKVQIETRHYYAEGLYAREIVIPKGTLLTGKIHLYEHINIISKGDISVLTDDGPKRIKAPCTLISKPGIKRVGFAHEETVWTTIHANPKNLKDADEIEAVLVTNSFEEFEKIMEASKCPLLP